MKLFPFFRSKGRKYAATFTAGGADATPVGASKDYAANAREVYLQNPIGFKCTKLVADSAASVPWQLFRVQGDGERTEITDHPIVRLLRRANPRESYRFLMQKVFSFLPLAGNAYLLRVAPMTGDARGLPRELHVLAPDRVTVLSDVARKTIKGYSYRELDGTVKEFPVDPVTGRCDVLHLKLFHPTDELYGASVVEPLEADIDSSNYGTTWNLNLLKNSCRPGLLVTVKGSLTDEQYDRNQKRLRDIYSGAQNVGKNLIIEGEEIDKVEPFGWSSKDMDFQEQDRKTARRIAYTFGVPPMLVGIPGDNTYSNYKEARVAFWEDTVIPLLQYFQAEINNWLFGQEYPDLELSFNVQGLSALEPKNESLWSRAQAADFVTYNEKRGMVGLEDIDGGDVLLIPSSLIPIGESGTVEEPAAVPAPEEEPPEEEEPEEEPEDEEAAVEKLVALGFDRMDAMLDLEDYR